MSLWDSFTSVLGSAWDTATDWFTDEAVGPDASWLEGLEGGVDYWGAADETAYTDASWLEGLEGGFDYWGAADETAYTGAAPSFFDQASDFFSAENIKEGVAEIAKQIATDRTSAAKRGINAQDRAKRAAADALGSGRGIGVSGTAPGQQFTPGSVRSLIERTNAGKIAFQPGTVDARQNLVNIISEAFVDTGATSPTGAGKISPSASKIEKVGTSYFRKED